MPDEAQASYRLVSDSVPALTNGFSRVALGVHLVSDVVGGYLLGAAWVAAMTVAFNVVDAERGRYPHHASPWSAAGS